MNGACDSDYLKLPIACVPSRRFEHGQPYEYRLLLNTDEVAMLRLVAGKGWALTIVRGPERPPIERGLFATIFDALMVLYAEFRLDGAEQANDSPGQFVGNG
jgi:hypothetical protein